ncbi:MAG TPA: hypothetical protein VGL12_19475 [Roseiarcus sp.]
MSQVATRRNSVSQRRRAQSLIFAGLGVALAGLAWLAMAWSMLQLQAARCPADTFFCASGQIATAVQIVPLFLPALGIGFLIATWLDASLPTGLVRSRETGRPSGRHAGDRAQMLKLSLILLALTLPVSFAASLSQFCLGVRTIAYQAAPLSGFRTYEWEDVASVTATCHYRRGRYPGWTKQLIVTMRDGAAFDLMSWPAAAARAYPAIAEALRGRDFFFDAKDVAPQCPEPYFSMLTHRP